jgi:glycosyltransferase involved in cell wall biosynthesis/GT2 family glycosyltransferase
MERVSVVIPVKDGERHLDALLAAVEREAPDAEVLVLDSGSTDASAQIARDAGARVVDVDPAEFRHGQTRNLGAELTSGELICFLTQDAEPLPGWLDAYREAFALDARVGVAFGPHRPRPDTSPMIARELLEFFDTFSATGAPVVMGPDDPHFLSNVNACYARACWTEIRFDDVDYAEDQAFGRAVQHSRWRKVYHPGAAVLHAHDYGPVEFMRRYFDEYRGLRQTTGHIEPFGLRGVGAQTRADRRWMRERGWPAGRRTAWTARAAAHHAGRRVFAALGSRSERLPAPVQRTLSLERSAAPGGSGRRVPPEHGDVLRVRRDGPSDLLDVAPGTSERPGLHFAFVVPPFGRGSGGHAAIFTLVVGLERLGHTCSTWVHDPGAKLGRAGSALVRQRVVDWFAPVRGPVTRGFDGWHGADVVVATGWETVYPVLLQPGCRARVYLVHDHEPEFFATSAERQWAEETYEFGLYPISGGRWLRDLLAERYGTHGSWYRFGVDSDVYRPLPRARSRDTVIFYARAGTARRAVPLGFLALEELVRRRPRTKVVTFGQDEPARTELEHVSLGVAPPATLAAHYAHATVGLCLSLTNYSLIPQEMMACGLPSVDVSGGSGEAEFGRDGGVEFAPREPLALADAMEALLEDRQLWARRSEAGLRFVRDSTWEAAARQVEAGLREALRRREPGGGG